MSGGREFYDIMHEGKRLALPRVTSILSVIDKSNALMGWATKLEREAVRLALEDVRTTPGAMTAMEACDRIEQAITGQRAWVTARDSAANVGTEAHALVHWHTHRMLGHDAGPEPGVSDAAIVAVSAWLDWCKAVDFTPVYAERIVYCPRCAYAGTLDSIALVDGTLTLVDWKPGRAVYPDAFLQNIAYRHAATREGMTTEGGLILRLPKKGGDPAFEAVRVPTLPYDYFLAASHLWRWKKMMDHHAYGPDVEPCEVIV